MGHYDDQYEEEDRKRAERADEQQKALHATSKAWLHERIDAGSFDDILFLKELVFNLNDYRGYFKILDKKRP